MFRTRDFVLLFSAIMFLVMAIGTTLINQGRPTGEAGTFVVQTDSGVEYLATVAASGEMSRAERVAQMRSKISQQALITEVVEEEVVAESSDTDTESASSSDSLATAGAILCPTYRSYAQFWDARDLTLIESEGTRVLTRGDVSSTSIPEVVLQLPARTAPSGNPSCVSSDVIGIANDGSLIRNDEVALYSIFSSDSLIGFALDGFPIYGTGTSDSDACGGVMTPVGYRYELSSQRTTMINCFAAIPVLLP